MARKTAVKKAEEKPEVAVTFDSVLDRIDNMSKTLTNAIKAMEKNEKALSKVIK